MEIVTARGRASTFGEGCHRGNLLLQVAVHDINGHWPGFPAGGGATAGAVAYLACFGAVRTEDAGKVQSYQGEGRFWITGPDGEELFRDDEAFIVYSTLESTLADAEVRPEHLRKVSVSGTGPLGAYGLLTMRFTVNDQGRTDLDVALAHVNPPASGALKRALRAA